MKTRRSLAMVAALLILSMGLAGMAQTPPAPTRVLVVDETKTFLSTMRVAGLVGALRQMGLFEVGVALGDVTTSYDDPLAGQEPNAEPYDLAVILPRGLDDGSIASIWIVSNGLDLLAPPVRAGVEVISQVIEQVYAGIASAVDVHEDLFPAFLWGLYVMEGWMK